MIYIVRHPVRRIESAWRTTLKSPNVPTGHDYSNINQLVRDEFLRPWFVDRSKYLFQISAYRDYFSDDQILILFFEDFKIDPERAARRCFKFLGLNADINLTDVIRRSGSSRSYFSVDRVPVHFLRKVPFFSLIRDSISDNWRNIFRKAFKRELRIPEPKWEASTYNWVIDQLGEDAHKFLEFYGKSFDYWRF